MAEYPDMSKGLSGVREASQRWREHRLQDHLDVAAAEAIELAGELATPIADDDDETAVIARRLRVAAHLTYMAGLIRGSAPVEKGPEL